MCTDVERVSPIPAIAANCESTSESDEHLVGDRDSEGHEDARESEWDRLMTVMNIMMMRLVRLIILMSEKSHETDDDELDEISDL